MLEIYTRLGGVGPPEPPAHSRCSVHFSPCSLQYTYMDLFGQRRRGQGLGDRPATWLLGAAIGISLTYLDPQPLALSLSDYRHCDYLNSSSNSGFCHSYPCRGLLFITGGVQCVGFKMCSVTGRVPYGYRNIAVGERAVSQKGVKILAGQVLSAKEHWCKGV